MSEEHEDYMECIVSTYDLAHIIMGATLVHLSTGLMMQDVKIAENIQGMFSVSRSAAAQSMLSLQWQIGDDAYMNIQWNIGYLPEQQMVLINAIV